MYEENNSQDKPVVIGIDHGFSLMKTKHHIFGNGVVRCNGRPPVAENSFYYDDSVLTDSKSQLITFSGKMDDGRRIIVLAVKVDE